MAGYSDLIDGLPDSAVSRILTEAANANYPDALPLAGGEPCFPIFDKIISSLNGFDEKLITKYSPFKGHNLLLELIQKKLQIINNINADLNELIVVPGGSFALIAALMAVVNPADEVLISNPCWEHYVSIVRLCRAKPVRFNMRFDGARYTVDMEHLKSAISQNTKAILLNTPLNPIGSVLSRDEAKAICQLAKEKNFWILIDEEYETFIYDHNSHYSARSEDENVITLFSFSKSFALTGIRLGYIVAPKRIINLIRRYGLYTYMYPSSPSQCMAIHLLSGDYISYLSNVAEIYQKKMSRLYNGIKDINGIDCWRPEGGVYLFPRLIVDSKIDVAKKLISEFHLLCVPGYVAGEIGKYNIRLFIGAEDQHLYEAASRLILFMKKYQIETICTEKLALID